MTWLSDSGELVAGGWISSAYPGHGIAGALVPSTGTHGPAILYPGLNLPAEAADEFRALILTQPGGLSLLQIGEDSSIVAAGPDGVYTGTWRGYRNGVVYGPDPSTYTIVIGEAGGSIAGGATLDDVAAGGALTSGTPSALTGGATLDGLTAGGALTSGAPSALTGGATLDGPTAGGGFTDGSAPPNSFTAATRFVRTEQIAPRRASSMGKAARVSPIDVAEEAPIDFIFTDELAGTGVTISSASFEVDVRSGADADPNAFLLGSHTINAGGDIVTQWVRGRVPSTGYAVRCVALGSDNRPRTAVANIQVKRL